MATPHHEALRIARPICGRGVAIVYLCVALVGLCAIISLAVDWGRVQVAKAQLQHATEAAALHAARGLEISPATARANAKAAASENRVDMDTLTLTDGDIDFGQWVPATRTFTQRSGSSPSVNAVRVTGRRTNGRGTAIPLLFGQVIGQRRLNIFCESIALYQPATSTVTDVPASSNPWLAGSPNGTLDNTNLYNATVRRDRAGPYTDPNGVYRPQGESPSLMSTTLTPGDSLAFDSIAGTGAHGATQVVSGPDGNTAKIQTAWAGAHLGKSNVSAPIDAVMGVFLTDADPSTQSPPASLDFSTAETRDFLELRPKIGQVFFIGDGRTSGDVVQSFIVPEGATRLYIAKMDGNEWNNNVGTSQVTTHRRAKTHLVK